MKLLWELIFGPILSFGYSDRNDLYRWRNHLSDDLPEGSQELRMKASADMHTLSLRKFKRSYTRSLNVGGLVVLLRHLDDK